jgi:tetratricopeptide (TPR) repeat protein
MPRAALGRTACHMIWALVVLTCLACGQAGAQERPPPAPSSDVSVRGRQLDDAFARLKAATAETDGDAIVAEIWKLWLQSGRPDIDEAMQQAVKLMGAGLGALAMPILDDIVGRAPDWAEGWNKRATALYFMGEHDRSLADIDRVLALEPRHFGALAGQGLNRIAREEYREALSAFRRALAVNPFLKERLELIPALEKKVGEKPI